MVINRQNIIFWMAFILAFFLAIQVAGYFANNADSFIFVKRFIAGNKTISKEFGHVRSRDVTLSRIYEDGDGDAEVEVTIHGGKRDGKATIKLTKARNEWRVINASIETKDEKRLKLQANGKSEITRTKGTSWIYGLLTGILTGVLGIAFIAYRESIANKIFSMIPYGVRLSLVVVSGAFVLLISFVFLYAGLRGLIGR